METELIKKMLQEAEEIDWYQKFEVIKNSGIFTPGWATVKPDFFFEQIGLPPEFFKNKRVLDIGADAGAYSYFLEDYSAKVTAMDPRDPEKNGFNIIKTIRGSNVDYVRESIYYINPKELGYFDIILLVNICPQLKHPLLAMEKINSISKKNTLLIGDWPCCDTWFPAFNVDEAHECGANFEKITKKMIWNKKILTAQKLTDISTCGFGYAPYAKNTFFYPNISCLKKWLEVSGFKAELLNQKRIPLWSRRKGNKKCSIKSLLDFDYLKNWHTDRIRNKRKRTMVYFIAKYFAPVELEYGERQLQSL